MKVYKSDGQVWAIYETTLAGLEKLKKAGDQSQVVHDETGETFDVVIIRETAKQPWVKHVFHASDRFQETIFPSDKYKLEDL